MNMISVTTLALLLTLTGVICDVSAAGAEADDNRVSAFKPVRFRFTPDQRSLLAELGIDETFNVDTAPSSSIEAAEKSIVASMIFEAVKKNNVFRARDGYLYLKLLFRAGDASICLKDWEKNPKKVARMNQEYGHLLGAQKA